MKMSSRCHRLLIYDVKQTTKIDGMGPFNMRLTSSLNIPVDFKVKKHKKYKNKNKKTIIIIKAIMVYLRLVMSIYD